MFEPFLIPESARISDIINFFVQIYISKIKYIFIYMNNL